MKRFKNYISEGKYYLEVDNKWDAFQVAKSSEEAVKLLFPKAKSINWIGSETDGTSVYEVITKDKEYHNVTVHLR